MDTYTLNVAGLTRELPLCRLNEGTRRAEEEERQSEREGCEGVVDAVDEAEEVEVG